MRMTMKNKPDFTLMFENFNDLVGDVQARYHQTVLGYVEMLFTLVEDDQTDAAKLLIPQIKDRLAAYPDTVTEIFAESRLRSDIEDAIAWDLDEGDELVDLSGLVDDEDEGVDEDEDESVEGVPEETSEPT
jgi:hypothetical protein